MDTNEVAKLTHVDLKNLWRATTKRHGVLGQFLGESIPPFFDHLLTFNNPFNPWKVRRAA
jgi:hypothetical protein